MQKPAQIGPIANRGWGERDCKIVEHAVQLKSAILMCFVPQASAVARAYPNGVSSRSPGLIAIGDLPWVEKKMNGLYPNGVAPFVALSGRNPVGVVVALLSLTQGSPPTACNPGLEDKTPLGYVSADDIRAARGYPLNWSATDDISRKRCACSL